MYTMGLSIYSVELRTKKSYSTEYILSCFGGGDWRIFSVENVLNVPYSVGGGRTRDFFLGYEKNTVDLHLYYSVGMGQSH